MMILRRAKDRGYADHGWLQSAHTFSFANYHDPAWMGFRALRVINDDQVAPGKGFSRHAHANMEIISYVLQGTLQHQDSMGNGSVIKPGEIQRMSAGTGVEHSEVNPSSTEKVHLLQIWLLPAKSNIPPSYEQRDFPVYQRQGRWQVLVSPHAHDQAVAIHQDARMLGTILDPEQSLVYSIPPKRHAFVHVVRGSVVLNDTTLHGGDGVAISEIPSLQFDAVTQTEILLFDLA